MLSPLFARPAHAQRTRSPFALQKQSYAPHVKAYHRSQKTYTRAVGFVLLLALCPSLPRVARRARTVSTTAFHPKSLLIQLGYARQPCACRQRSQVRRASSQCTRREDFRHGVPSPARKKSNCFVRPFAHKPARSTQATGFSLLRMRARDIGAPLQGQYGSTTKAVLTLDFLAPAVRPYISA